MDMSIQAKSMLNDYKQVGVGSTVGLGVLPYERGVCVSESSVSLCKKPEQLNDESEDRNRSFLMRWRHPRRLRFVTATFTATCRHIHSPATDGTAKYLATNPLTKRLHFSAVLHCHYHSQIDRDRNPSMSYCAVVGVKPPELIAVKVSKAFVGRKSSLAYVGCSRVMMATRAELDRRAHEGETVVPGGTGGHSLEAQEHLAEGRHKGGETRAHQLGHEGFVEMGKKGGFARHGADPYQAAIKHGVDIDEHKFMNETSIEELDRRAREGETVVPGGTGGHSFEAQKHLAEGRYKGGVNSHLHDEV